MSFKGMVIQDMDDTFTNPQDFGENVVLIRDGVEYAMSALYDEPSLDGSSVGADVDVISHHPRLFVSSANLPNGRPAKGDKFRLEATEFHSAVLMIARDFDFEKDGSVVYYLQKAGL